MGFLDHSTNNIIVDAVLTDIGRHLAYINLRLVMMKLIMTLFNSTAGQLGKKKLKKTHRYWKLLHKEAWL